MVNVSHKPITARTATARGSVSLPATTFKLLHDHSTKLPKGDVLTVSQIAGIQGAKHTASLIPLCHPLLLSHVSVDLRLNPDTQSVDIEASVQTCGQTGVEMEALTAVSVAALTVYDMCKAAGKQMVIRDLRLVEKTGGKSGDWRPNT